MRNNLSDKEFEYSRQITNVLNMLPSYMRDYTNWMEDNYISFSQQTAVIKDLQLLFECIVFEKQYNSCLAVTLEDLYCVDQNLQLIEGYIKSPVRKSVKNRTGEPTEVLQIRRWKSYESFKSYMETEIKGWRP